jgi:hypothetical protein
VKANQKSEVIVWRGQASIQARRSVCLWKAQGGKRAGRQVEVCSRGGGGGGEVAADGHSGSWHRCSSPTAHAVRLDYIRGDEARCAEPCSKHVNKSTCVVGSAACNRLPSKTRRLDASLRQYATGYQTLSTTPVACRMSHGGTGGHKWNGHRRQAHARRGQERPREQTGV